MKTNQSISQSGTPAQALNAFIRSYSTNMSSSLEMIVNIINQAKNEASKKSRTSYLQQASDTVNNMKQGLELMRENILRSGRTNGIRKT